MSTEIKCEYCGSILEPLYATVTMHDVDESIVCGFHECGCPDAVAAREREAERDQARERMLHAARLHESCRKAGIPPRFAYPIVDASEHVEAVVAGRGFRFVGPNGTGKTAYAAAVAKGVLDEGRTVVFTSSSRMKGELFSGGSEEELFRKWSSPWLLVIDDLGKEHDNKVTVPMLYRVIDERYGQMKPVIVTSNLGLRDLAAKMADGSDESCARAVASRLAEMTELVEFDGPDRRLS